MKRFIFSLLFSFVLFLIFLRYEFWCLFFILLRSFSWKGRKKRFQGKYGKIAWIHCQDTNEKRNERERAIILFFLFRKWRWKTQDEFTLFAFAQSILSHEFNSFSVHKQTYTKRFRTLQFGFHSFLRINNSFWISFFIWFFLS